MPLKKTLPSHWKMTLEKDGWGRRWGWSNWQLWVHAKAQAGDSWEEEDRLWPVAAAVFWGWCHVGYQPPTTTTAPCFPWKTLALILSIPDLSLSIHCYSHASSSSSSTKLVLVASPSPWRFWFFFFFASEWIAIILSGRECRCKFTKSFFQHFVTHETVVVRPVTWSGWIKCRTYSCMVIHRSRTFPVKFVPIERNIVNHHQLRIWMEVHTCLKHWGSAHRGKGERYFIFQLELFCHLSFLAIVEGAKNIFALSRIQVVKWEGTFPVTEILGPFFPSFAVSPLCSHCLLESFA